jgi:hypothetical protein
MLITIMIFVIFCFMILISIYSILKDILAELQRCKTFIVNTADDGSQTMVEVRIDHK